MTHPASPTLFDQLRETGRELKRALRAAAKRPTFSLIAIATLGIGNWRIDGDLQHRRRRADASDAGARAAPGRRAVGCRSGRAIAAGAGRISRVQRIRGRLATDALRRRRRRLSRRGQPSGSRGSDGVNLKVALITGNLFDVLGVEPLLGRNLRAEDDRATAAPVIAISYELWQRRYGRDPAVLGRVMTIQGQAATVVAVMPRGFAVPAQTDVWATTRPFRSVAESGTPDFYVYLVGRLATGATVEQAASELTNFLHNNAALLPPWLRDFTVSAETLDDSVLGDVRPVIRLLLAASALVMLVAMVNVGALFLALGLTKRQELAVRVSLGATPRRLLMLAFADASIVAGAGAVLGIAIAYAVVRLVVTFASTQLPRADAIDVNGATLAVAVALAVLATMAFAICCVYGQHGQRRGELSRVLIAATRGGGMGLGTRASRRTQRVLVSAQVALAVTVILGAGLVARSQLNLETLELGLAGDRILVAQVVPPQQDDFSNPKRFNANLDRVIEAVAALPGVQGVTPLLSEPFGGMSGWDARYLLEGQAPDEQTRQPLVNFEIASPDFFRTLGVRIPARRAASVEPIEALREG